MQTAKDSRPLVVEVRDYSKRYGKNEAVKGISFAINRGEIFGLIGPDVAGKTTTFHALGGVMEPTAGEIKILGQTPRLARKKIGYLTQQFSLHLDLSIEENLEYSAGVREVSPEQFHEEATLLSWAHKVAILGWMAEQKDHKRIAQVVGALRTLPE